VSSEAATRDEGEEATPGFSYDDLYAKHKLYLGKREVLRGAVRLPDTCYWRAAAAWDAKGYVNLGLHEKHSDDGDIRYVRSDGGVIMYVRSYVESYLTSQEALELSEQLRVGATERFLEPATNLIGTAAPDLDVNVWSNCEPTSLASLRDKVVVLAFWGYSEGYGEMPILLKVDQPDGDTQSEATTQDTQIGVEPTVGREICAFKLENVPLSELLQTMLGSVGLEYEVRPGFVWISTPDVLAEEPSVPPEVLAQHPLPDDKSPDQLAEELRKKLGHPVGAEFEAGTDVRDILDYISNFYDMKFVLDERVMLPPSVMPPITDGTVLLVRLLNELSERYWGSDVEVITVHSAGMSRGIAEFIVKEMSITFRFAVDKPASETAYKGATGAKYGATDHTVIFVIDRNAKIRYQDIGLPEIKDAVKILLAER
jgi:hypothetical protein